MNESLPELYKSKLICIIACIMCNDDVQTPTSNAMDHFLITQIAVKPIVRCKIIKVIKKKFKRNEKKQLYRKIPLLQTRNTGSLHSKDFRLK